MKPDQRLLMASRFAAEGVLSARDTALWTFCLDNDYFGYSHDRAEILESLAYDGMEVKP